MSINHQLDISLRRYQDCSIILVMPETGFDECYNVRECGIVTLYDTFGARDYVGYQCMLDRIDFTTRGLGLVRTRTLVDADCCDFRVVLGGDVHLEPFSEQRLRDWRRG